MKFNYEHEKRVFEKDWMYIEKHCLEVGITSEKLEKVKAAEWEVFKRERSYRKFTVHLPEEEYMDGSHPLEVKCPEKFCREDTYFQTGRYDWVENISNTELLDKVKCLTLKQLDLLTQYVFEERNQAEIAKGLGVSQAAVSQQINTIMKKLK